LRIDAIPFSFGHRCMIVVYNPSVKRHLSWSWMYPTIFILPGFLPGWQLA
jgi:hypothetical protein